MINDALNIIYENPVTGEDALLDGVPIRVRVLEVGGTVKPFAVDYLSDGILVHIRKSEVPDRPQSGTPLVLMDRSENYLIRSARDHKRYEWLLQVDPS